MDDQTITNGNQQVNTSMPPPSIPPPIEESHFPLGTILKIAGGILIVLVVGFLMFLFAGSLLNKPSNEKVTLQYWGLWEDEKVMNTIINEFERENPNITVTYSKRDIKRYRESLSARIKNGNPPDIFRYHNSWLPMLKNNLLPIPNSVISKKDLDESYYPVVKSDLVRNGALYGIPLEIDTLSLFVNTELLKAQNLSVPKTWNEFIDTARKLTVPNPETGKIVTAGAAIGTFDNIAHAPDILALLFAQNGANMKDLEATKKNASGVLTYYTLFARGDISERVWDETLDPSIIGFSKGSVGMIFGYSWDIFTIEAIAGKDFSYEVHPVPYIAAIPPTPKREMTIASYWVEGVYSGTKYQKQALEFMKFLAKKESQQKLFTESSKTRPFGEPYSRTDLARLLSGNKQLYPFVSQAPKAVSTFFIADTQDPGINTQMNNYLGNAVRSTLQNTSAESAVEVLSQGVSQVLKQYGE